jgi:hypothetical protein
VVKIKQTKIDLFDNLYKIEVETNSWITKDDMTNRGFFPPENSNGKDIRFVTRKYEIEEVRKGTSVTRFRVLGTHSKNSNRGIRSDIVKVIRNQPCAMLKTKANIEVDHKNGRYNDERVLNLNTQNINDFQPLCKTINNIKRESCKKCKLTGERFDAKIYGFLISNLNGESIHNGNPEGCKGCFFYDVEYFKEIHSQIVTK